MRQAARWSAAGMGREEDPRQFFGRYHTAYQTSVRHARGEDLARLVARLGPKPGDRACDVATGAGHTAIRLAECGAEVVAVDVTPEMLADTAAAARQRGLSITVLEAPAEQLPLADASLDLVTCRRAAHHFRDVHAFLDEARRCLKPGGRLGISDMTGSLRNIGWLNRLEHARDPSHRRALAPDEWYDAVVAAGFGDVAIELTEEPLAPAEWLDPVPADSPEGRAALAMIAGPDAPREFVRGDRFIKRRLLLYARA
jgi:SAM-dependent methyltransferase